MNKTRNYNRHSIRMKEHDYSKAGAYYVTICTQHKECLFGVVVNGEMQVNDIGQIVADEWIKINRMRHRIE